MERQKFTHLAEFIEMAKRVDQDPITWMHVPLHAK